MKPKKIPFLTRAERQELRDEIACAVVRGDCRIRVMTDPRQNPRDVYLRGQTFRITRVILAEIAGEEPGDREVNHVKTCLYTGGDRPDGTYDDLCINPVHLVLGDPLQRLAHQRGRGRCNPPKNKKCTHGPEQMSPAGECRACRRVRNRRYYLKHKGDAT